MKFGTVLAVLAVLGMVSVAMAQDSNATSRPARGLMGQVVKVDAEKVTVKRVAGRGDANTVEVVVVTDAKTVVTVDGKDAKVADLVKDLYLTVTPATGTAEKIVATKEAPPRRGRAGGAAPAAPAN